MDLAPEFIGPSEDQPLMAVFPTFFSEWYNAADDDCASPVQLEEAIRLVELAN